MRIIRGTAATAIAITALGMGGLWGAPAHANIVVNGDFGTETNSGVPPDSWTATGNAAADQSFPNPPDAWEAFFGDPSGSLAQTLPTPGTTYTVSFSVAADSAAFNDLSGNGGFYACFLPASTACTAGADLFSGGIPGGLTAASMYTPFSDTVTATQPNMVLTFVSADDNGGTYYLADVDVEPVAAPEPSAVLIVASALGLLTLIRVRRA